MTGTSYTLLGYAVALTLMLGYAGLLWLELIATRKHARRVATRASGPRPSAPRGNAARANLVGDGEKGGRS